MFALCSLDVRSMIAARSIFALHTFRLHCLALVFRSFTLEISTWCRYSVRKMEMESASRRICWHSFQLFLKRRNMMLGFVKKHDVRFRLWAPVFRSFTHRNKHLLPSFNKINDQAHLLPQFPAILKKSWFSASLQNMFFGLVFVRFCTSIAYISK